MSLLPVLDAPSGWRLAPETQPPAALWPQAMLMVTTLDEITGEAPGVSLIPCADVSGLEARASGNLAGLVGRPLRQFLPGAIPTAPLELTLSGPGFLPVTVSAPLVEPAYPNTFTPASPTPPTVALHRAPVTISGRAVSHTGVVRNGATLSLAGVWLTLADLVNPPAAPNLATLASPLYADRDTTAGVAAQPMTAAPPAETKALERSANVGDLSVHLSDQVGLTAGSVIAIDPQDPGRAEYLAVTGVVSLGAGPTFPAIVTLAHPLGRPHAAGASAIRMVLGAAGAVNALSTPARAGDVTLLLASMTGVSATPTAVVITGSGPPAEYHLASPIGGVSDADGYVTLPPVHRVAQLQLRAHHASEPTDLIRDIMLPLGVDALTLDFVFP
jgi:hypothetical protein